MLPFDVLTQEGRKKERKKFDSRLPWRRDFVSKYACRSIALRRYVQCFIIGKIDGDIQRQEMIS